MGCTHQYLKMYKVYMLCVLLAAASAAPADHQATSFVSFNGHHNSVHHIHSASGPSLVKYAAPAAPTLTKVALSVAGPPASSYYNAPAPIRYSAPAAPIYATKVALPVVAKVAAPAASSYYNAPASIGYSAPSAQVYAAPAVAKVALPIASKQIIAPVTKYAYAQKEEEYGPAKYEFAYVIEDPHTGDYHSQQEHRDGHHVVGQYSLHEADGTVRIVKYSDEGHGFNAVVERQGHPTEAPSVYKKVIAVAAPQYASHH